jgi:hypothetical protein
MDGLEGFVKGAHVAGIDVLLGSLREC